MKNPNDRIRKIIICLLALIFLFANMPLQVYADVHYDDTAPVLRSFRILNSRNVDARKGHKLDMELEVMEEGTGIVEISVCLERKINRNSAESISADFDCKELKKAPLFTGKKRIKLSFDNNCRVVKGNYKIVSISLTDANGNTNYRGVLYDWNTDTTGNTQYEWSADSTSYYREPANLSSSTEGDEANSSKIEGWSSTLYQEEYNKMIKSVSQYGGFYVGRYEMSLNSETKNAESKYGATSANASDTDTNQWYGLYNRAKTYAPENASQKVVSSMIWGSQYDAMLKWMKGNGIDVTSTTPTDLSIGTTSKNTTRVTGGANNGQTVSKDKLSNIYDLLGNSREWTQEAISTNIRVYRGGRFNNSSAPSIRRSGNPPFASHLLGSRLTLYIK